MEGIVLAADSAITVSISSSGQGQTKKITESYFTLEKVFSLGKSLPVGIVFAILEIYYSRKFWILIMGIGFLNIFMALTRMRKR